MSARVWIAVTVLVFAGAVFAGSLYTKEQTASAQRSAPVAEATTRAVVVPEMDPAYAEGSIQIAVKMGVRASDLRRRYDRIAEKCGKPSEEIWGEHVRVMRRFGDPPGELLAYVEGSCLREKR